MYVFPFSAHEKKLMATPHFLFLLLVFAVHVAAQCGNGIVDSGEECDLGAGNGLSTSCCAVDCSFQPASRQCRLAAGPCDEPEMCTGAQATCPPDQYRSSDFPCRAAVGPCDRVEFCTGLSVSCPVNTFMSSSTVCRPSSGDCDPAELCTGLSAACPPNAYLPNTEMCRPQQGLCDVAEYCTGATPTCPVDTFISNGTVCRPLLGRCDIVERCTGISADCPADAYQPNTTECRSSAGDCDLPEFCTGADVDCPVNVYAPSTQECRAQQGICDQAENCTGIGPSCPVDSFLPSSTLCEAATGACVRDTYCSGNAGSCPQPQYRHNNEVCRPPAGDCDVAETCLGEGEPDCPPDARRDALFVCRPAKSECDQEETCQGDVDCPPDEFTNSSFVCRQKEGDCDVEETCTGLSPFCPPNLLHTSSQVCEPANVLQLQCTFASVCTGLFDECPDNKVRDGVSCTVDGDLCFLDTCVNGTCVRGPALNYDDGIFCNGQETCDPNTGLMIQGSPFFCGDGDSCTYDICNETSQSCEYVQKPNTAGTCFFGDGGCLAGSYSCNGIFDDPIVTCVGAVEPTIEVCGDGIDNDCDFQVDEYCSLPGCSVDADCANIVVDTCDIVTCQSLTCTVSKKPTGTVCSYFRNGQYNGTCTDAGVCEALPIICDDGNPCTEDSFSTTLRSCVFDPLPLVGTECVNGDPLVVLGMCTDQGTCMPTIFTTCAVPDVKTCTTLIYNETAADCQEVDRQGSCDDSNLCTKHDICVDGQCRSAAVECDDGLSCTTDSCLPGTGECLSILLPNSCYIDGKCYSDGDVNEYCACSVCNSTQSQIEWSFTFAASPCDDFDPCTHSDQCDIISHSCVGLPLDCSSFDTACTEGVCRLGRCETVSVNEEESCDDDDACTIKDVCRQGSCVGEAFNSHLYSDQCNVASCLNGTITYQPVSDFLVCNAEADICLGQYYCLNGECVNGGPLVCPSSSNECTENVCETEHGCIELPRPGLACNDSNVCTIGDMCGANGACVPGAMTLNCDDLDPCTDDFCLPDVGCVHVAVANCTTCAYTEDCSPQMCQQAFCIGGTCHYFAKQSGTSCSDADVCNGREVCAGNGVCVSERALNCDDNNPCTDDSCDSINGCQHTINTLNVCSDGNECTINDTCQPDGTCQGTPSVCPASTRCAEYSCYNGSTCFKHARNVGSWCDSGDACTHSAVCTVHGECVGVPLACPKTTECIASYSCVSGQCVPVFENIGTPCRTDNLCVESLCDGAGSCVETQLLVNCTAPDQCRLDGVCIPQTGECVYALAPDETVCDDGDACTTVDKCKYGDCVGYEPVVCQSLTQCHDQGVCDPNTGTCSTPWVPNFTPCVDDAPCSVTSVCIFGNCISNEIRACPLSENQCLTPRCDPNQGCLYDFSTGTCDDGNACTVDDTCVDGSCRGVTLNCSHQSTCGLSYCSPTAGCLDATHDYCDECSVDSDCPYFPCKSASCEGGFCVYDAFDEAVQGCNDGVFCNGQEYCFAGTCMLATPPSCDDGNACTYDDCVDDMCTHTPTPNVTCYNDDLCAVAAQCDGSGHCLSIVTLQCDDVNGCVKSTGCNAATGFCEYIVSDDGTPCVDDDLCSVESECRSGVCHAIKKRNCSSDYSCETSGVCDIFSGRCLEPSVCDVRTCEDGIECTLDDRCGSGECRSGIYSSCETTSRDQQCQVAICHENGTCTIDNVVDQTPCDTGVPRGVCSGVDVCVSGACTRTYAAGVLCRPEAIGGCDVADMCVDNYDHCPEDVHRANNVSCPSSLYCFESSCQDGTCVPSVPRDCSQFDGACSLGVCDELSRTCKGRNRPDDITCVSGEENQCTPFSRCLSGICTPYYANELTICEDGDPCTRDSFCSGYDGTCTLGTPIDCTYLDSSCGSGFCDSLTGTCQPQSLNEGQPCNADSDACTVGDFCHQGLCVAGPTVDCSHLNSSCQHGECQDGTCVTIITGPECEPDYCAGGCTVPFQWWSLHNSKCKSRSKRFRWPDDLENARVCGQTYYRWSQRRARNAWRMLMHQWLAATLNEANGACVPPEIITAAGDAFNLLLQCNMTIEITGVPGRPYRQLASLLYSYNTGTKGPGTCLRPSCARQTSSAYFSCLFPQLQSRDVVDEEDISQLDCTHGLWDYVSDVCDCELGWSGPVCNECGVPDNEEHTFLCVPLIGETSQYILRSIPDEELYLYVNDDETQLRQLMQIAESVARYPGDGVVDCACNVIEQGVEERSTSLVVYGDISVYITEIERNLQDCEQVFDVVVYNNNLDCDPNTTTTIIIDDETANCSQPENWNYICDCCLEDDDECACPNNDILCLRNHLIRNHQRKELYELLAVIFMALTGLFFILLVGYYVRRYNAEKPERKEEDSQSLFLAVSRQEPIMFKFGHKKKKRNYD